MKERIIRISLLTVVFVLALIGFSYYTNRGNADMTADMGSATLPTISFTVEGQEINLLAGHVNEMDIMAVRDKVTPLDTAGNVVLNIQKYEQKIQSLTYRIYSVDGKEKRLEKTVKKVEETLEAHVGDVLDETQEGLLQVQLDLGNGRNIYYYTRVTNATGLYFSECMDYVKTLHTNILKKQDTDSVKRVMESNEQGDNTTLQHVTIHSDLEHIIWGKLNPKILGQVRWNVAETKAAYTSIQLEYQVSCAGDNNDEEIHNVKEFFRVRYVDGKYYLLSYDRTMEEVFNPAKVVLISKGIILGLTTQDMQYKLNEKGTIVSFIQADELWSYNKEDDEFSLVFSFADSEKEDVRNRFDRHSLKILSMENDGNLTFAVYGYMNRGAHEGESGVAIYYFDLGKNVVEEKAFIPSNQSHVAIEKELGKLAYYSDKNNMLYVLAGGTLCKVDLETNERTDVLEQLEQDQYVSSEDGHLIAYQKADTPSEAVVLDFATDSQQTVKVAEGEVIQPLGFVMGDFVYGIGRNEDVGTLSSGEPILGMYQLEIRDSKNQLVKTYGEEGSFLIGIKIETNMITLNKAVKQGNVYTQVGEDYITNNEEKSSLVTLQSYWTDLKETQFRLIFEEGIDNKKAKLLKPKQVLFERDTTMAFAVDFEQSRYGVFGLGELIDVYGEAGEAVQVAKEIAGVVISPRQNYVWEDGNRVSWYRNFEIGGFRANSGESALAASVRAVLEYEDVSVDVATEMQSKSALQILDEFSGGEAVRFKGGSSADMRYLIDKGVPVIAMTGSDSAIVLVGYDAQTITYIDPSDGGIRSRTFAVVDELTSGSGHTFLGYAR